MDPVYNKFEWSRDINLYEMASIVRNMEAVVDDLAGPYVLGSDVSLYRMESYCVSLVAGQLERQCPPATMPPPFEVEWGGCWYVGPRPIQEDIIYEVGREYGLNDYCKNFVDRPTYAAVSILTLILIRFPRIIETIPRASSCLRIGLAASSQRISANSMRNGIEALALLKKGRVLKHVAENPDFSPKMYERLTKLALELSTKASAVTWREKSRKEMRDVLQEFGY
jgi:hypothetical protein